MLLHWLSKKLDYTKDNSTNHSFPILILKSMATFTLVWLCNILRLGAYVVGLISYIKLAINWQSCLSGCNLWILGISVESNSNCLTNLMTFYVPETTCSVASFKFKVQGWGLSFRSFLSSEWMQNYNPINLSRLLKLNSSGYTAVYSRPYIYRIRVLYVEI